MTVHAYLFEVRAIQPFLFASGKLKDMVAGSELIDFLCSGPLASALESCGLADYHGAQHSPRCAGGAFYLLIDDAEKAQQFRYLWPMLVAQLLPGIEQVHACVAADTVQQAMAKGLEALQVNRNRHTAQLPAPSPLAMRSPRTGQVAIDWDKDEPIDAATKAKRYFNRPKGSQTLTQRFCPISDVFWPDNFESDAHNTRRFPLGSDNLVGLVHIDGNGLGEILRVVAEATHQVDASTYIRLYRHFSEGINHATTKAAQQACTAVLQPAVGIDKVMPARPLVLGGDDLTVLIKADLTLPFTEAFIKQLEASSSEFLTTLKGSMQDAGVSQHLIERLPSKITACAGVVFMKHSQPFTQCYELAESLCNRAKLFSRDSRPEPDQTIPSSLSFHKIQGSLIDDADRVYELEMQTAQGLALAIPVYGIGNTVNMPHYDHLMALTRCFGPERLNEKRLRAIATLLHSTPELAKKDYARWRSLAGQSCKNALHDFDTALSNLLGSTSHTLPANSANTISPLADILMCLSINGHTDAKV